MKCEKRRCRAPRNKYAETPRGWFLRHKPVFIFLLIFGVLMCLFYMVVVFTSFYEHPFTSYLGFNAKISGRVLNLFGQDVTVRGMSISSLAFSITLKRGCDAIEPTALFICAILAFPAAFIKKVAGVIAGALLLAVLNVVRIVTLFLVGFYLPSFFELMHADIWQGLFIFLAIFFWIIWLLWLSKSQTLPAPNPKV